MVSGLPRCSVVPGHSALPWSEWVRHGKYHSPCCSQPVGTFKQLQGISPNVPSSLKPENSAGLVVLHLQIRYMVETQGQPPDSMLNAGQKTGCFFDKVYTSSSSFWKLKVVPLIILSATFFFESKQTLAPAHKETRQVPPLTPRLAWGDVAVATGLSSCCGCGTK